eukprot:4766650-Alexandrium_andersonii.AAC.1
MLTALRERPAPQSLLPFPALVEASASLREDELLFAFLDDVYVLCEPNRIVEIFAALTGALERHAGVQ